MNKSNQFKFKDFLRQFLNNKDNGTDYCNKKSWLYWPPNTFLITSKLLQVTGCYRFVYSSNFLHEKIKFLNKLNAYQKKKNKTNKGNKKNKNAKTLVVFSTWQEGIEKLAEDWIVNISQNIEDPNLFKLKAKFIENIVADILACKDIDLNIIRTVNSEYWLSSNFEKNISKSKKKDRKTGSTKSTNGSSRENIAEEFISKILILHAICDEACTGIGLMGSRNVRSTSFRYLANLLLTAKGSLSTLSKHLGVVLPKLKTPSSGLTLRSISHHLTYHVTEVEVMWRNFPWANIEHNSLNILCICLPEVVKNQHFIASEETFSNTRYFNLENPVDSNNKLKSNIDNAPIDVYKIIARLRIAEEMGVEKVHCLVMPESTLSEIEFRALLIALNHYYCGINFRNSKAKVPIVITGVRREKTVGKKKIYINELRIAIYFSDKWYFMSQRKHHRWKLDSNQLKQYGLASKFSTNRDWFENVDISQRRLSIICASDWLTLCPLICEDLARLEPVSEIIRGVGPSLLLALLADGPQLSNRWSARYASVFADDPGTSVITLTSKGMVEKSLPLKKRFSIHDSEDEKKKLLTCGLWKDYVNGFKTLDIKAKEDPSFIITLGSSLKEEFTADGRSDHGNGSVLELQAIEQLSAKRVKELREITKNELNDELSLIDIPKYEKRNEKTENNNRRKDFWNDYVNKKKILTDKSISMYIQDWTDLREITAAGHAIDTIMDIVERNDGKLDSINLVLKLLVATEDKNVRHLFKEPKNGHNFYFYLSKEIISHFNEPNKNGIAVQDHKHKVNDNKFVNDKIKRWSTYSLKKIKKIFKYSSKKTNKIVDYKLLSNSTVSSDKLLLEHCNLWYNEALKLLKKYNKNSALRKDKIIFHNKRIIKRKKINWKYLTKHNEKRMYKATAIWLLILIYERLNDSRRSKSKGSQIHSYSNAVSHNKNDLKNLFNKVEIKLKEYGY